MAEVKKNKLKIPESSSKNEIEEPVLKSAPKDKTKEKTAPASKPKKEKAVEDNTPKISLKERVAKFVAFYQNERTQKDRKSVV